MLNAKFEFRKDFNTDLPFALICPCIVNNCEINKSNWVVYVVLNKKINNNVFEGEVRCVIPTKEKEFSSEKQFILISNPKTMEIFANGELIG